MSQRNEIFAVIAEKPGIRVFLKNSATGTAFWSGMQPVAEGILGAVVSDFTARANRTYLKDKKSGWNFRAASRKSVDPIANRRGTYDIRRWRQDAQVRQTEPDFVLAAGTVTHYS